MLATYKLKNIQIDSQQVQRPVFTACSCSEAGEAKRAPACLPAAAGTGAQCVASNNDQGQLLKKKMQSASVAKLRVSVWYRSASGAGLSTAGRTMPCLQRRALPCQGHLEVGRCASVAKSCINWSPRKLQAVSVRSFAYQALHGRARPCQADHAEAQGNAWWRCSPAHICAAASARSCTCVHA